MLHVERGRTSRDAIRGRTGEPLAQVTLHRRGGQCADDGTVHAGGAREHQEVHVVSEVRIILKCLGKQERDAVGFAGEADVAHQLEGGADPLAFRGTRCRKPVRDRYALGRQALRGAHQHAVGSRHVKQQVPVELGGSPSRAASASHKRRNSQCACCILVFTIGGECAKGVRSGSSHNTLSGSVLRCMIQRRFGVVWQACHSFGANYVRLIGATEDHAPLVRMKTSNVGPVLEGSAGAAPRPTGRGNSTPPIGTSIVPPAYAPLRTGGPNRSCTLRSSNRAPTRSALETSTDTLGRCPQL